MKDEKTTLRVSLNLVSSLTIFNDKLIPYATNLGANINYI